MTIQVVNERYVPLNWLAKFISRWILRIPPTPTQLDVIVEFASSISPKRPDQDEYWGSESVRFMELDGIQTMKLLVRTFRGCLTRMAIKFVMVQDERDVPDVDSRRRILETVRTEYKNALKEVDLSVEIRWLCYMEWDRQTWYFGDAFGHRMLWQAEEDAELTAQKEAFSSDVEAHVQRNVAVAMGMHARLGNTSPLLLLAGEGEDFLRILLQRVNRVGMSVIHQ
jgi:hypothetical protein